MAILTSPQIRYLQEIRFAGERRYNGRARRPLEAVGLVTTDYEIIPHPGKWTELFTARPASASETDPRRVVAHLLSEAEYAGDRDAAMEALSEILDLLGRPEGENDQGITSAASAAVDQFLAAYGPGSPR